MLTIRAWRRRRRVRYAPLAARRGVPAHASLRRALFFTEDSVRLLPFVIRGLLPEGTRRFPHPRTHRTTSLCLLSPTAHHNMMVSHRLPPRSCPQTQSLAAAGATPRMFLDDAEVDEARAHTRAGGAEWSPLVKAPLLAALEELEHHQQQCACCLHVCLMCSPCELIRLRVTAFGLCGS